MNTDIASYERETICLLSTCIISVHTIIWYAFTFDSIIVHAGTNKVIGCNDGKKQITYT